MRALVFGTALALTLTFSACGSDSDDAGSATTVGAETTTTIEVPDIVGDSVEDATATLEAEGLTLRVIRRDGEDLAATADFVENRVNVAVETQDDGSEVVTEVVSTG